MRLVYGATKQIFKKAMELSVKQKTGHRMEAAIIRNIHHDRKLRMECEALQKAKQKVESDMRHIVHKKQRHSTGQEPFAMKPISNELTKKTTAVERRITHSNSSPQLKRVGPKLRTLSDSALTGAGMNSTEQVQKIRKEEVTSISKINGDAKTVPDYEKRFLNMLKSSNGEQKCVDSGVENVTKAREGNWHTARSKLQRTSSNGKGTELKCNIAEIACSICSERIVEAADVPVETQTRSNHGQQRKGAVDYSWNLAKMNECNKRRCSGVSGVVNYRCHTLESNGPALKRESSQMDLKKNQEKYGIASTLQPNWKDSELRRGSMPISVSDLSKSTAIGNLGDKNKDLDLDEIGRVRTQSDGYLSRLRLDGFSDDRIKEYRQKISNPLITKEGEIYCQEGCFITKLKKRSTRR